MATYSFATAKEVMSETDKDRFLCCYLNSTDMNAVSDSIPIPISHARRNPLHTNA